MRFEYDSMVLWYGTADTPAPSGSLPPTTASQVVTIAVQPPSVSNSVQVIYRVNGGAASTVNATIQRQDLVQKVQYFTAQLPAFHRGDTIDYIAVARSPGRQVPSPTVVLQVSNADKFVAERLSCVFRLPNRKGCR